MDADRWLGSTGDRWPCYLPNSAISESYGDEASATAATKPSVCWLPSHLELTTCSPASCVVCRASYVDVTATESSSSHASLLKPAAAAAEDLGKQTNDAGES